MSVAAGDHSRVNLQNRKEVGTIEVSVMGSSDCVPGDMSRTHQAENTDECFFDSPKFIVPKFEE